MTSDMRRWVGWFTACVTLAFTTITSADTRYYLVQAKYDWQINSTEDSVDYRDDGVLGDDEVVIQTIDRSNFCEPIDLTVVLKFDDLNGPGRKARVTYYFQNLGYTDELRQWAVNDFSDAEAIRKVVDGFITQGRRLGPIPLIAAYEEEAVACLLLMAHQRSMIIDLDVPTDTPDPLIYQADALIYDTFIGSEGEVTPKEHGVAWFASDDEVRKLQEAVLSSDVKRVERLRHMLWGHLKSLALFVENHQYEYFNPRGLSDDAPIIAELFAEDLNRNSSDRDRSFIMRHATFSEITPAYAFPALYRWASLSGDDFAQALGESAWQRVGIDQRTQVTTPDMGKKQSNSRSDRALERMELTREGLSRYEDLSPPDPNQPRMGEEIAALRQRHKYRQELGQRYLDTLVRLHQADNRGPVRSVAPGDHGWVAILPISRPNANLFGERVANAREWADDSPPYGQFGLWLTSLDRAHFEVKHDLKRADIFRINYRGMVVDTTIRNAPLFVPGLPSDGSSNRLAIVDVEATTRIEGKRLSAKQAEEYLKTAPVTPEANP